MKHADLRRAVLSGAELVGADLSGANVIAAAVDGANMTGIVLREVLAHDLTTI